MNGPDWYCPYCDKTVPHIDTRDGHHAEAKGGCGNVLQTCKFDPAQAPKDWKTMLDPEKYLGAAWVEFPESTETVPKSLALRAINLAMADLGSIGPCPECNEKTPCCHVCGSPLTVVAQ